MPPKKLLIRGSVQGMSTTPPAKFRRRPGLPQGGCGPPLVKTPQLKVYQPRRIGHADRFSGDGHEFASGVRSGSSPAAFPIGLRLLSRDFIRQLQQRRAKADREVIRSDAVKDVGGSPRRQEHEL